MRWNDAHAAGASLDKQITVVDVTSPLQPGLPKTLFHHEGDFGIRFAGQRMLLASGGETARPMTIVLNATAALRK